MSDKGYLLSRLKSFGNALEGLKYILKTQQNARIHAVFTLAVFLLAYYLKLNRLEWVGLALVIAMVWIAEIFNTAVEVVIDMISPEHSQGARIVKDISAGAVLVSALFSVLVGILIFGPRLLVLFTTLFG